MVTETEKEEEENKVTIESHQQHEDEEGEAEEEMSRIVEKVFIVSDKCVESILQRKEQQKQKSERILGDNRVFCFGICFLFVIFTWSFVFYVISEEFLEIERYRAHVSWLEVSSSASASSTEASSNHHHYHPSTAFQNVPPSSSPSPSFAGLRHNPLRRQ